MALILLSVLIAEQFQSQRYTFQNNAYYEWSCHRKFFAWWANNKSGSSRRFIIHLKLELCQNVRIQHILMRMVPAFGLVLNLHTMKPPALSVVPTCCSTLSGLWLTAVSINSWCEIQCTKLTLVLSFASLWQYSENIGMTYFSFWKMDPMVWQQKNCRSGFASCWHDALAKMGKRKCNM